MPIIIGVLIIIADQISKVLYVNLWGAPDVTLIDGILNLTYVQNRGAAWGIFSEHQIWLYIFSGVLIAAMIFLYARYYKSLGKLMRIAGAMVIAGALGNMIDRVVLGYVRDMIQFAFIDFPVFNIADSAISIGAVLLFIDCLFLDGRKFFKDTEKEKIAEETVKSPEGADNTDGD